MPKPRKFAMGAIVYARRPARPGGAYVVVDHRTMKSQSEYRIIPLDSKKRRRGDAIWMLSWHLTGGLEKSGTASIKTYRANEANNQEVDGRGCSCQCCIHEAQDHENYTNQGKWKPDGQGAINGKGA